ncbi:MAG TPA: serine hydrolase domain-containing protein [Solirubrobacteraceae bacterium]|nr:serine hydrolase domain-containing protein [Solirubrobacteraceae bacterium]
MVTGLLPPWSVPRLPLVPDPLRRIRVPRDPSEVSTVGPDEDPDGGGVSEEAVEAIWDSAVGLYRSGVHPTVQLCLRRNGVVVLDRAVGHARGNGPHDPPEAPKVLATPQTPFCVYSTSKALTAVVIHLLGERGALDIADRVSDYIPEYARRGKGDTTIAHVLSHRAGVPAIPPEALNLDRIDDPEFIIGLLCNARPIARPGTLLAYHAISGGFILGEIVHRVTGKSIREVLAEEILDPLGFRWTNYGVAPADIPAVGRDYVTGPRLLPPLSTMVRRVLSVPVDRVVELAADPRFLTAVIPAGNVVTTAHELSRFFEILRAGGELDGVRVMAPETIRRALTQQAHLELDLQLGFPIRYGYGLMLGAKLVSLYGRDTDLAFGHFGFINIAGWADPERALSGALITSGKAIVYPEVLRFYGVMQRIASELPKVPRSALAF